MSLASSDPIGTMVEYHLAMCLLHVWPETRAEATPPPENRAIPTRLESFSYHSAHAAAITADGMGLIGRRFPFHARILWVLLLHLIRDGLRYLISELGDHPGVRGRLL
jgi:hypothetical protein